MHYVLSSNFVQCVMCDFIFQLFFKAHCLIFGKLFNLDSVGEVSDWEWANINEYLISPKLILKQPTTYTRPRHNSKGCFNISSAEEWKNIL
jgi:hypothetical protein